MAKSKTKPTSIRPKPQLLEKIDSICEKLDCSRNDYIISTLESAVSEDLEEKNNLRPSRNTAQSLEPNVKFFDERDGKLYLQSDNSFFGNSSDYNFDETKVYDKNHNLVGKRAYVRLI